MSITSTYILIVCCLALMSCQPTSVSQKRQIEVASAQKPAPTFKKPDPKPVLIPGPTGPWQWVMRPFETDMQWYFPNTSTSSGCVRLEAVVSKTSITLSCHASKEGEAFLWKRTHKNLPKGEGPLRIAFMNPDPWYSTQDRGKMWTLCLYRLHGKKLEILSGSFQTGERIHQRTVELPPAKKTEKQMISVQFDRMKELRVRRKSLGESAWGSSERFRWNYERATNNISTVQTISIPSIPLTPWFPDEAKDIRLDKMSVGDLNVELITNNTSTRPHRTLRLTHGKKRVHLDKELLRWAQISQVEETPDHVYILLSDRIFSHVLVAWNKHKKRIQFTHQGGSGYLGPRTSSRHHGTMKLHPEHIVVWGRSFGHYATLIKREDGKEVAFIMEHR